MSESDASYGIRQERQRSIFPELQVGSPDDVFSVDSLRRKTGQALTSLGRAAETAYAAGADALFLGPVRRATSSAVSDASSLLYQRIQDRAPSMRASFSAALNPLTGRPEQQIEEARQATRQAITPYVEAVPSPVKRFFEEVPNVVEGFGAAPAAGALFASTSDDIARIASQGRGIIRGLTGFDKKALRSAENELTRISKGGSRAISPQTRSIFETAFGKDWTDSLRPMTGAERRGVASAEQAISRGAGRAGAAPGAGGGVADLGSAADDVAPLVRGGSGGRGGVRGPRTSGPDLPGGGNDIPIEGRYRGRSPGAAYRRLQSELEDWLRPVQEEPFTPNLLSGSGRGLHSGPRTSGPDLPGGSSRLPSRSSVVRDLPPRFQRAADELRQALPGGTPATPADTLGQRAERVVAEVLNASRQVLAGPDLSAIGRQGIMLTPAHPVAAVKALRQMGRSLKSDDAWRVVNAELRSTPVAQIFERSGGYLADIGAGAAAKEEAFISSLPRKIPGFGWLYGMSERAHTSYLNALRVGVFDSIVSNKWDDIGRTAEGALAPEQVQRLATYINAASGRGDLPGFLKNHGPALNAVMFAPRFLTSRVQSNAMALKAIGEVGASAARGRAVDPIAAAIAKDALAFYAAGSGLLAAAAMSDKVDVELDSRSSSFGKIRVGSMTYDIWAGHQQLATLIGRLASGEAKSARTGNLYEKGAAEALTDFLRAKLSPTAGFAVDWRLGRNIEGKPFELTNELLRNYTPIIAQQIKQLWDADMNPALAGFEAIGVGTNIIGEEFRALDAEAQKRGYESYSKAPNSVRNEIEAALPEAAKALAQERAQGTGIVAAGERAVQKRNEEYAGISPTATGAQLRNAVNDIDTRYRGARQANEANFPSSSKSSDPMVQALNSYYDAVVNAPDGSVDEEATQAAREALMATLTEEQRAYIQRETEHVDPNLPEPVRELKQTRVDLTKAEFWDLRNKAWLEFKAQHAAQLAGLPDDYFKWRDLEVSELAQQGVEAGYDPRQARLLAADKVGNYKAVTAFNEFYRKEFRHQWVMDNPDLAAKAWYFGYFNPDKQEETFLTNRARSQ